MFTRIFLLRSLFAPLGIAIVLGGEALAVRIETDPASEFGDPSLQFDNIALTPDGGTLVGTGLFKDSLVGSRVYSMGVPANPATTPGILQQLSSRSFLVDQGYDVAFPPVISPDGQTILYTHDNGVPPNNTIYKMPIAGELDTTSFTGLFGGANLVSPGIGNFFPTYSPDGATIYFLNSESAFNGSVPDLGGSAGAGDVIGWSDEADWDQLYRVPAAGGTPVAVTLPGDGDIDAGLFAVTPDGASIVYAPDNPITAKINRGDIRPALYTIPSSGGTAVEIPLAPTTHAFSISSQLAVTPNGQNVLFIADYETVGKNELFSVPIAGGTPTRVSGDLPFAGDVTSFAISPDGASVAYAAGQNNSANNELFLTPVGGGSSVRISDPIASNTGVLDVSTSAEGGQIVFSPDSSEVYYLGDADTDDVNDLYVVDTTEKAGLVPSPFVYTGPAGGDFFNESNWQDAQGASPPANSINPGQNIRQSLVIDNESVVANGGEVRFQLGGSLELTPGAQLSMTGLNGQLQFFPGSGLKLTDATIVTREDIILAGTNHLSGGSIESQADDIEFQDRHETLINGTTLIAGDNLIFDNSATSITGATLIADDSISMRYEIDVTVTDTSLDLRDEGRLGGIEDRFTGAQGEGSTLTLKGSSTLIANAIKDGIDLVIDDTSVATLLEDSGDDFDLVDDDGTSTITLASTGAELILLNASLLDARQYVINGLTGLSYLDDPSAWNVTDWNGVDALASLRLAGGGILAGDYNDDGVVDAADYTVWRDNLGGTAVLPGDTTPGQVSAEDYTVWESNYGAIAPSDSAAVPEPGALAAIVCGLVLAHTRRGGTKRS